MLVDEFKNNISNLKEEYIKIRFKIETLYFLITEYYFEKNGESEVQVRLDKEEIIKNFLYKEKELIYFVSQFLSNVNSSIPESEVPFKIETGMSFPPLNDVFPYYFDSLIIQFSSIIEPDQKKQIEHYFNNDKNLSFYPNRNQFGLWWEIYMLRNRLVHFTETRYSEQSKMCSCFETFSSKCNMIRIDEYNNIIFDSTLIDIYKSKYIKSKIEEVILSKGRINPFDLIFSLKSPKGYGKKEPAILHISDDIYFDYASSGVRLLNEISNFLNNVNGIFFTHLYSLLKNKDKITNNSIALFVEGKELTMQISELFIKIIEKK